MNYYIILLVILAGAFIVESVLAYLNNKLRSSTLPKEAEGIYDEKKYATSQKYESAKYRFGVINSLVSFAIMFLAVYFGLFGWLDSYLRDFIDSELLLGLSFFGIITLAQILISLPFAYYATFNIEGKFGFNKMTKELFFMDKLKGLLLSFVIGGIIYSIIYLLHSTLGDYFWLAAWLVMTLISIFMMMFYSSLIVPIFNKQTPLEEGELRTEIEKFASEADFTLDNIFVIDGSKRSSKANAYFSGFGPKKRIVLFDTLIEDLSTKELVAVLAHEIGHYKKHHTLQMLAFSIVQTGLLLFIFSYFVGNEALAQGLGANQSSFHIGLLGFGLLFTPISMVLSLLGNILSRKNEYEADAYAAQHYSASELSGALRKLTTNNLSNLTPHPAYEFFYYSHPNVLKRLALLTTLSK